MDPPPTNTNLSRLGPLPASFPQINKLAFGKEYPVCELLFRFVCPGQPLQSGGEAGRCLARARPVRNRLPSFLPFLPFQGMKNPLDNVVVTQKVELTGSSGLYQYFLKVGAAAYCLVPQGRAGVGVGVVQPVSGGMPLLRLLLAPASRHPTPPAALAALPRGPS